MKIHPTAEIESGAVLREDVEIGAFSLIGAEVTIGEGSVIQSHVVLEGVVQIGRQNVIGHGTIIGGPPQDLSFDVQTRSSVRIGDHNVFREHCTVHRGTAEDTTTQIGDGNFFMAGVHVGHNSRVANGVIIANNSLLGGYVRIDDGAFIGGGSVFHQHTHVGRLVMTQGNSGFGKDIPPFLIGAETNFAVGVNIVGLRRAGFTAAERDDVKRAFKLLFRSGLNTRQAIEEARETDLGPRGREFFEFVASAQKRGVVAYRGTSSPNE